MAKYAMCVSMALQMAAHFGHRLQLNQPVRGVGAWVISLRAKVYVMLGCGSQVGSLPWTHALE